MKTNASTDLYERYKKRLGIVGKQKLVEESRWLRIYEVGPKRFLFESRFRTDGIALTVAEFREVWPSFAERERQQFCVAYVAKPKISREDAEILNVLMETGDAVTWRSILPMLPRHPDKLRVVQFLSERLEDQPEPLANYYHALEVLNKREAVAILERKFAGYEDYFKRNPKKGDLNVSYMHCCKALWKLTRSKKYKVILGRLQSEPS